MTELRRRREIHRDRVHDLVGLGKDFEDTLIVLHVREGRPLDGQPVTALIGFSETATESRGKGSIT